MKSVCGIRRFDKHRAEVLQQPRTAERTPLGDSVLQERLRQREEQDRVLFSAPAPTPTPVPVPLSPSSLSPSPSAPSECPSYTPWKTPSVPRSV